MRKGHLRRNVIQEKSFALAVQILHLGRKLRGDLREFGLADQLVRAGTSIGANVEEALGGQSRKDFIAKMSIAAKETRETHYWLRLARESELLTEQHVEALLNQCQESLALLNSIILSTRQNSSQAASSNSEFIIQNSEFLDTSGRQP